MTAPLSPRPQDGGRGAEQPGAFDSALLLGEDHTELEEVAIREITPNLAIGISRGRFPKGYPHVDPNEDAVYAATDGTTTILVVADGHHGFDAARAAISAIADAAPDAIAAPLEVIIRQLADAAIDAVAEIVPTLPPPRNTSRTSLTICAVRGDAIAATTIGDTAWIRGDPSPLEASRDRDATSSPPRPIPLRSRSQRRSSHDRAAVILTTDGFLDFASDVTGTLRSAAQLDLARQQPSSSSPRAFAGGAGDNISVAVYRRP